MSIEVKIRCYNIAQLDISLHSINMIFTDIQLCWLRQEMLLDTRMCTLHSQMLLINNQEATTVSQGFLHVVDKSALTPCCMFGLDVNSHCQLI